MRLKLLAVAATVVALAGTAAPAGAAQPDPFAGQAFNILVPGQTGDVPPDSDGTDQKRMFDRLAPLFDDVSAGDLRRYFKSARFSDRGRREPTTNRRVRIVRDRFGVPHISARRRSDVIFGIGWVTGADRGLLLEFARYAGRVAAADVPGLSAFGLITSARIFVPSPQSEALLSRQIGQMRRRFGAEGRQMVRDIDSFTRGINAQYRSSGNSAPPWGRNDVLSLTSLIGDVFGEGGGDEVRNSQLLAQLRARLGPQAGTGVWNDLMRADDAEAPTTTRRRFPYHLPPAGPTPGSLVADPGSASAAAARAAATSSRRPPMSNALLVSARRSASGHPLAVMGPQLGYFYPEIVLEMDIHGGGMDARGINVPGTPYMLIGRGKDYGWSLTSANHDVIDQYLVELCNPDGSPATRASRAYRHDGRCRPFGDFVAGVLRGQAGSADETIRFPTTVYGPVTGTVTVSGRPYAVTRRRSGYGRDTPGALKALKDLSENDVRSARDFPRVANQFDWTFNWLYLDDRDIAFFSSGRLPVRAPGVHPLLPTLGDGRHDWRGFLSRDDHPQATNPPGGVLVNWNNRPAPGWGASDDNQGWGSVQRVELFKGFKRRGNRLHDVVGVMNKAATQDLRVIEVWPVIRRLLAGGPAPDPRTKQAADLVTAWERSGGSRLDRELDGRVDAPGAAIIDAAWPKLAAAVLSPVLGDLTSQLDDLHRLADSPDIGGDQFDSGWYGYLDKDLRTLLGDRVAGPFSRRYCGGGDVVACRESVWAAMRDAANELAAVQGPDPAAWRADANKERLGFVPGLIPDTIRWVNRPTFQQALEFDGHRPRARRRAARRTPRFTG